MAEQQQTVVPPQTATQPQRAPHSTSSAGTPLEPSPQGATQMSYRAAIAGPHHAAGPRRHVPPAIARFAPRPTPADRADLAHFCFATPSAWDTPDDLHAFFSIPTADVLANTAAYANTISPNLGSTLGTRDGRTLVIATLRATADSDPTTASADHAATCDAYVAVLSACPLAYDAWAITATIRTTAPPAITTRADLTPHDPRFVASTLSGLRT